MDRRQFLKGLLAAPVVAPFVGKALIEDDAEIVEDVEEEPYVWEEPDFDYEWKPVAHDSTLTYTTTTTSTLPVKYDPDTHMWYQLTSV